MGTKRTFSEALDDICDAMNNKCRLEPTHIDGGSPFHQDDLSLSSPYGLMNHQKSSLAWIREMHEDNRGCILALDMGLGKTLVSMYHMASTYLSTNQRSLVVCPKTVLHVFKAERLKFFGHIPGFDMDTGGCAAWDIVTHESITAHARRVQNSLGFGGNSKSGSGGGGGDCRIDKTHSANFRYFSKKYYTLVVDESHRLKNRRSALNVALHMVQCRNVICMTGTPFAGVRSMSGMRGQLELCGVHFPKRVSSSVYRQHVKLVKYISTADTDIKLPRKKRFVRKVELSVSERAGYNATRDRLASVVQLNNNNGANSNRSDGNSNNRHHKKVVVSGANGTMTAPVKRLGFAAVLSQLRLLRMSCILPVQEVDLSPKGRSLVGGGLVSGRLLAVCDAVIDTMRNGDKCVVFSSFPKALRVLSCIISHRLTNDPVKLPSSAVDTVHIITGDVSSIQRETLLRSFSTPGSPSVLLVTTSCGSTGLNLAVAHELIFVEPPLRTLDRIQAESRLWRLGQTRDVNVTTFVAPSTMEMRIMDDGCDKGECGLNTDPIRSHLRRFIMF